MKTRHWRRTFGGLLVAAIFAATISFSTSTAPSGLVSGGNSVLSGASAFDCMWAYYHGPSIRGGGPGGVSIEGITYSAYFEWALWLAGCGGPGGPSFATDVDLHGHGGNSAWGRSSARAFYSQMGDHYGVHSGTSAHFVMGYFVAATPTQVDFGWPPSPPGTCGDYWQYDEGSGQCLSPIIIHLKKGEPKSLTSAAKGVQFDIDADGVIDQVSWTKAGNKNQALLVYDRNGNGTIDDGSELFGNFTVEGAVNGFEALQKIEPNNGDAVIDANDSLYAKLQLWVDLNHDGVSQGSELQPASNYLESIGLGADIDNKVDKNGNRFAYRGWATFKGKGKRTDRELDIYDIFLVKQ